jgi:hypothetical protein
MNIKASNIWLCLSSRIHETCEPTSKPLTKDVFQSIFESERKIFKTPPSFSESRQLRDSRELAQVWTRGGKKGTSSLRAPDPCERGDNVLPNFRKGGKLVCFMFASCAPSTLAERSVPLLEGNVASWWSMSNFGDVDRSSDKRVAAQLHKESNSKIKR